MSPEWQAAKRNGAGLSLGRKLKRDDQRPRTIVQGVTARTVVVPLESILDIAGDVP